MIYQIVSERRAPTYQVSSPSDAFKALDRYKSKRVEHFFLLSLNAAHELMSVRIVSIGGVARCPISPREIFRMALAEDAVAIIVAHSHPSGNNIPSEPDKEVTRRIKEAGDTIGVPLLDHVVFSKTGFYSFVEHGLLESPRPD